MAALGNVGKSYRRGHVYVAAWTLFGLGKVPLGVDMAFTGVNASSVPFSYLILTRNAVQNLRSRTDASGIGHFYDMDDSGGQVYGITSYTQAGPTGEAWTATVAGTVATVTKTFAANRAIASAFSG